MSKLIYYYYYLKKRNTIQFTNIEQNKRKHILTNISVAKLSSNHFRYN